MNKTMFDKKMANSIHLEETIDGVAEKSINSNLRDYRIFGNTVQDNLNLFDLNEIKMTDTTTNEISISIVDGAVHIEGTPTATTTFRSVQDNTSPILFKKGVYKIIVQGHLGLNFYTVENNTLKQVQKASTVDTYTFTLDEDCYLKQWFIWFNAASVGVEYNYTTIPTITKNLDLTEEVPYVSVSPNNPIDIISVGDNGRNFYEKIYSSWVTEANAATITFDDENQEIAVVDGASKQGCARLNAVLIAGKTYTFSATVKECNSSTGARLYVVGTAFNNGSQKWSDFGQVGDRLSLTFTVEKTLSRGTHLGLYPYGEDKEYATATFSDISLVEGDPSKPYNIPIYVSGKNLFDKNEKVLPHPSWYGVSGSIDVSDNYISLTPVDKNVVNVRIFHCKVPVGEKITISASNIMLHTNLGKANSTIMFAFSDNPFEQFGSGNFTDTKANCSTLWYGSKNSNNPPISIKHTTTATKPYLIVVFTVQCGSGGLSGNFRIEDFQVELGGQQTAYEPYIGYQKTLHLTEPIRKIGEYQDYIDFRNRCVIRNCAFQKFNSAQDWMLGSSNSVGNIMYYKLSKNRLGVVDGKVNALLNNCKAVSSSVTTPPANLAPMSVIYGGANNYMYVFVGNEIAMTIAEWKTWLDNNDMNIVYALSSSITEDIELPRLPQYKGQTIYQIATNIPSEFVATYKYRL